MACISCICTLVVAANLFHRLVSMFLWFVFWAWWWALDNPMRGLQGIPWVLASVYQGGKKLAHVTYTVSYYTDCNTGRYVVHGVYYW